MAPIVALRLLWSPKQRNSGWRWRRRMKGSPRSISSWNKQRWVSETCSNEAGPCLTYDFCSSTTVAQYVLASQNHMCLFSPLSPFSCSQKQCIPISRLGSQFKINLKVIVRRWNKCRPVAKKKWVCLRKSVLIQEKHRRGSSLGCTPCSRVKHASISMFFFVLFGFFEFTRQFTHKLAFEPHQLSLSLQTMKWLRICVFFLNEDMCFIFKCVPITALFPQPLSSPFQQWQK